ncbi:MAG: hypothetical protein ACC655_02850 [Rhodothermia bacterium]
MIAPMNRALFLAFAPAILLTTLLTSLFTTRAHGQNAPASSDTTLIKEALDDYDKRLRYTILIDPFALYSRTFGFGIAAHFTSYNLLWAGSRWRVSARPAQRRGIYTLSLRTHDPDETNIYGLLHTTLETNNAYRYYGIGQSTNFDNLVMVNKDYSEVMARLGFDFLDDHLTIQPLVGYLWNKAGIDGTIDSTFVDLDKRSQEALLYAIGLPVPGARQPGDIHQGVRFGTELAVDFRDRRAYPRSGGLLRGRWERYQSTTDQDVVFDRFDASVHGYIKTFPSHVLAIRALVQTTENRGSAPIPFYLYPKFDFTVLGGYRNQRHINADLVNVSAEYRWPLLNLVDLYQVSTSIGVGVAGVYDDFLKDFEFDLSFDRDPIPGTNALRPGLGVGLRVSGLEQQVDYIQWQLGFGPEGFTLVAFKFVLEIGEIR